MPLAPSQPPKMNDFSYSLKYNKGRSVVEFYVQVIPRSPFCKIDGLRNGAIVVRVQSAPEHGKANEELKRCLAEYLQICASSVIIKTGEFSRRKLISVPQECEAFLSRMLSHS
jgi:uncharacterized protein YggU (UPF0235/DUF167 family)